MKGFEANSTNRHRFVALIPCAGKGTRMGSPPGGKELLPDPYAPGDYIVDSSIKLALNSGLKPVIILSSDKHELRTHILRRYKKSTCIIVVHNPAAWEEWPHSLLAAEKHWGTYNIVILPDTRFSPKSNAVRALKNGLESGDQLVIATHEVRDGSLFGVIKTSGPYDTIMVAEKPKSFTKRNALAWGLIGFPKTNGAELLEAFALRGSWVGYPKEDVTQFKLEWFKDITRKGVVEEYVNVEDEDDPSGD